MRRINDFICHIFNPVHVYCRLLDMGLRSHTARRACEWYERHIYKQLGFGAST